MMEKFNTFPFEIRKILTYEVVKKNENNKHHLHLRKYSF